MSLNHFKRYRVAILGHGPYNNIPVLFPSPSCTPGFGHNTYSMRVGPAGPTDDRHLIASIGDTVSLPAVSQLGGNESWQ